MPAGGATCTRCPGWPILTGQVVPSAATQTRDLLLVLMLIYLAIVLLFCTLTAHGRLPFRTVQLVRAGRMGGGSGRHCCVGGSAGALLASTFSLRWLVQFPFHADVRHCSKRGQLHLLHQPSLHSHEGEATAGTLPAAAVAPAHSTARCEVLRCCPRGSQPRAAAAPPPCPPCYLPPPCPLCLLLPPLRLLRLSPPCRCSTPATRPASTWGTA